jgi:hypothetical protein
MVPYFTGIPDGKKAFILGTLGHVSVKVVPCFLENGYKVVRLFAFLVQGLFVLTSCHFPSPTFLRVIQIYRIC